MLIYEIMETIWPSACQHNSFHVRLYNADTNEQKKAINKQIKKCNMTGINWSMRHKSCRSKMNLTSFSDALNIHYIWYHLIITCSDAKTY